MRTWLRVTLPIGWAVGVFVLLYMGYEAFHLYFVGPQADRRVSDFLIELAVLIYGIGRAFGFHPAFNPDYYKWLTASPWTNRKPLPAGPVHLVFQDVVLLAILAGVAWLRHPAISLPLLVTKFLMSYEFGLCMSFRILSRPWSAYAIAFGFGLVVLIWPWPLLALAVAAAIYVVSLAGLILSLNDFENWDLSHIEGSQFITLSQQKAIDRMRQNILGWPFDCIRPTDVAPSMSYVNGTMLSLLLGWWTFVLLARLPELPHPELWGTLLLGYFSLGVISVRLARYCWGYAPPISLWGRIFTLRWIIPGYDQVFLTPITILVATVSGGYLIGQFPEFIILIVPGAVFVIFFCALNLGPSLKRWRLTGNHRLSPAFLMATKQAEVQQV
ncbi:MAG TPA: hypothetical protein VGH74_22280 [Planctomycetaceae bacterium]|jgi:hypothetical protein